MTADPEAKCFLPGVPRATYLPYPFQIVQGDKKIMIVYGFAEANRTIHMDKASPEPPPLDSWMGRSHGRWEGDTLVVEVEGFNGGDWRGGEIPYLDEAREQRQKNFESRMTADPEAKCFLPGVPRATYLPYPFQIVQGDKKIMIVYGFAEANRTIHIKASPEPPPLDSWMGRSHGRWEGDR